MEKDIDKIPKNQDTDIIVRIDDFGGKRGLTIREFVRSERYTGFTKAGTRIPADKFILFKKIINSIDEKDLEMSEEEKAAIMESSGSKGIVSSGKAPGKKGEGKKEIDWEKEGDVADKPKEGKKNFDSDIEDVEM